jgi:hypothetical protein
MYSSAYNINLTHMLSDVLESEIINPLVKGCFLNENFILHHAREGCRQLKATGLICYALTNSE